MSVLIVGLGNPGKEYAQTRHNAGFLAVDALAEALQEKWKVDKVAKAEVIETRYFYKKVILAKPQTFMNLSGQSVMVQISLSIKRQHRLILLKLFM